MLGGLTQILFFSTPQLTRGEIALEPCRLLYRRTSAINPARLGTHLFISTMDVEKIISEIEWLERIFSLPDQRRLLLADREAANRKHDEMYADNPWFRLWKRYGV